MFGIEFFRPRVLTRGRFAFMMKQIEKKHTRAVRLRTSPFFREKKKAATGDFS
ncbi:hypothetical protein [Selenomonas sp.]|uniref:hypothetical protein n=1 Tax=Selenomonas sp. TaxID=2053611 RepID=UPI0025E4594B|nr:hypothetical protein [Selenomonas sp.]